MADGLLVTPGSGATISTDDLGGSGHVQRVKLMDGTNDSTAVIPGDATSGLQVNPTPAVVLKTATPTITAGTYATGNALGDLLTFATANRASGKAIEIVGARILDKNANATALSVYELHLFDRTFAATTDKTAWSILDSDAANLAETLTFATTDAFVNANGTVCVWSGARRRVILLNGTSLFGQLVVRASAVYAAISDIVVALTIRQL